MSSSEKHELDPLVRAILGWLADNWDDEWLDSNWDPIAVFLRRKDNWRSLVEQLRRGGKFSELEIAEVEDAFAVPADARLFSDDMYPRYHFEEPVRQLNKRTSRRRGTRHDREGA